MLKLNLYFQILSEQIHHHCLHVPSNATAIPDGGEKKTDKKQSRNKQMYGRPKANEGFIYV